MARTAIAVLSMSLPLLLAGVDATAQPARSAAVAAAGSIAAEIDRDVWAPVAASVANDDIVAMGRVYHPAAVLVTKAGTKPIAAALDGWGKDIVTAKNERRPGHGGVPDSRAGTTTPRPRSRPASSSTSTTDRPASRRRATWSWKPCW